MNDFDELLNGTTYHPGYITDPQGALQKLFAVVDGAVSCGAYIIVDWHSHVLHLEEATEFFTAVAERYKGVPNVIYELFNEPVGDSWADLKAYAESLIATITSIISLMEVDITLYTDRCHDKGKEPNRFKTTVVVSIIIFIGAALVAVDGLGSNGIWVPLQSSMGINNWNDCWLDLLDFISEGVLMPFLALMTSIVVGWLWGPKNIKDEIEQEGHTFGIYGFFKFCVKFVVPIAMVFVLLGQLDSFLSLGIFS